MSICCRLLTFRTCTVIDIAVVIIIIIVIIILQACLADSRHQLWLSMTCGSAELEERTMSTLCPPHPARGVIIIILLESLSGSRFWGHQELTFSPVSQPGMGAPPHPAKMTKPWESCGAKQGPDLKIFPIEETNDRTILQHNYPDHPTYEQIPYQEDYCFSRRHRINNITTLTIPNSACQKDMQDTPSNTESYSYGISLRESKNLKYLQLNPLVLLVGLRT